MAINKKLLHFVSKANFSTQLANSNIDSKSIVFIKDTGEIWTHDKLYSCASWGTNQTNYVPLTIGGTSYNLSKDGHTHSYLPLSGGTLTGDLSIRTGNTDKYITFDSSGNNTYNWRIGYLGTGSGDANYFTIQSSKSTGGVYFDALRLGLETLNAQFFGTVTAPTFIGALSGNSSTATALTSSAGSSTNPIYFSSGKPVASTYSFGNASSNIPISNGTLNTNLNADLLDGVHYQNILERNQSGTANSGTATGWFRIATFISNNAGSQDCTLIINRGYHYANNEAYKFSISAAYNGGINITQLSGYANTRLIDKIRVDYINSGVAYIELHISTSTTNNDYKWITIGGATSYTTWTPVSDTPNGTSYEFTTVNGCKSDRGFTGDLSGNSSSATKLSSSRTFALTGDVTGTITSDLTSGVSIATTIAANSVALGTDTTGNYAASVGVSGNGLTITGSAGEGTAFTVNSNATNANTGSTLVFRDASGNFSAGTITATLSGNAATATKVVATVTGTNTTELVRGNMADSDYFRILVGGTASDAGYAEIATADDGTEPIYVRQYSGAFTSLVRTAALLDEAGNTSFPGTVTASRFACSANNLMAMKDGYLAFQTYAGGITVGCTTESSISINNSAALGTTPTTWNWKAGSSSSWANFNIGSLTTYGTISASSTITTASYVSSAQGYYKSGSSNDYVLLGGGSHKSISDFRLQSEKVLKMVFRGYFTWTGTNSSPTSSNVVYSDFCTSYVISRVSTGRYRITFTGMKTTSSISADTTLQIFGAGRNINSDGTPCHVSILNVSSNYFDIITANNASPNDTSAFTLYINQML